MAGGRRKVKSYKCGKCGSNVTKTQHKIQCAVCDDWFHKSCSGLTSEEFAAYELRKTDDKWCCSVCLTDEDPTDAGDSESEREQSTQRTSASSSRRSNSSKALNFENIFNCPNPTNMELLKAMRSMFDELKNSITFNGNLMEQMKENIKTISNENKSLKKEQQQLKGRISELEKEVVYMKNSRKSDNNDNNEKSKNIVIVGLNGDDNASRDVKNVFATLKLDVDPSEYNVKPLPSQQMRKPVLVSFSKMEIKDRIMAQRKTTTLDVNKCGITAEANRRIFINQDLPKYVRELFKKALELRNAGYKYVWCKEENILVRRADGEPVTQIVTSAQVDSLKIG